MATIAAAHPTPQQRTMYGASTKLPDRTAINNNPPPFGQSTMSRRPEVQSQFQPNMPAGPGGRVQAEKDGIAVNELSDEQREEINEAVCG